MLNAFKITLGVMLGFVASLAAVFVMVLALHVAVIAGFTVYHLMHS
jgi:hypothetical protein